jgi:ankyrin repeat protein
LLEVGAHINAANEKGETALMAASQTCLDGKIVQVLLDAGADPNAKTTKGGGTALMIAAYSGNELAARELLKAGADLLIKDKVGRTAEDDACGRGEKGHARVCALLREALKK